MRDRHAEAERWLRQAEHDLAFGRLALKERFFAQACFVAQQTGEKALKAIAYAQGERVVIGHSLVELVSRLQDRVATLRARREDAGILDQYYVPTRYPNGLAGEHIALCARIVAVADVYDALTSSRPYKKAWPSEQAFEFLSAQRGRHFDPQLVDAFHGVRERVARIQGELRDPAARLA